MELSIQAFLDSVSNPNTKKCYRHGLNKFCEWYGKTAEQILELRKDDLTQHAGENLIEYRNRASRFEKEIEKFHGNLLTRGSINTARVQTLGIRQLFRYYEMPIRFRNGSKIAKTVKTTKNFPLTIEHVRKMFEVADLRERVILNMATDLGLRIGDFIELKKSDLPPLDQEPPIAFDVMTTKEGVLAYGFLSQETVDLLKVYLPTLDRKKDNPYLFPSNGKRSISDEWLNKLLQRLAEKAKINLNGKCISFHCFRKMFLSTAIDSGIGLTAGKKLCGKAIAQSDDTYLTTVNLKQKFIQLKKFLTIKEQPRIDTDQLEALKDAVTTLQEDLTRQKLITETISQSNLTTKKQMDEKTKEIEGLKKSVSKIEELTEFLISMEPEDAGDFLEYRLKRKQSLEVPETVIDIPYTPTFQRKIDSLMKWKKENNEPKISLNELLKLSQEASLEDEAVARTENKSKNPTVTVKKEENQ